MSAVISSDMKHQQILVMFNFLDLYVLTTPIQIVIYFSFTTENFDKIYPPILAIIIIVCIVMECFIHTIMEIDFIYWKDNINQGRGSSFKIMKWIANAVMAFMYCSGRDNANNFNTQYLISSCFGVVLGVYLLVEDMINFHFEIRKTFKLIYMFCYTILIWESIFNLILATSSTIEINMGAFNIDALTLFIFPALFKLLCIARQNRLDFILSTYIYDLQNEGLQDIYMQNLTACLKNWKLNHDVYQRVLTIFTNHLVLCNSRACLCFYLKYHYGHLDEKANLDQLARDETKRDKDLKIILYDDIDIDKAEERKKDIVNFLNLYSVNLYSNKMKTVMASFYYNCVSGMKNYVFGLYCSYTSYLFYEVDNSVGALIAIYNLWYSKPYRENSGVFTDMIVMNYQDLITQKIHSDFVNSGFWLSKTRLTTIFEYYEDIDNTKSGIEEITKYMAEYYDELSNSNINYKVIMNIGNIAWKLRVNTENTQDKLYKVNGRSIRLLCTYINYEINIKHHWNGKLAREQQDLYYSVRADEKTEETFTTQLKTGKEANMYKQGNMVIFLNIINSEFFIAKATKNSARYFEYLDTEFNGMNVINMMPKCIADVHDKYQLSFMNQRERSIMRTSNITSFAIGKNGMLKMVSLYAKLEYFFCDDAFLCGLLIPHPRNKKPLLVFDEKGAFIAQNVECQNMIGTIEKNSNLCLFMAMPLLYSHFVEEDREFEIFQYDFFLTDFSRFRDDPEYKQLNKEWDTMNNDKDVYVKKLMNIQMKIIMNNKMRFRESIKGIQKLKLKIETYHFKRGVTMKLIEISKSKEINPWIIKFQRSAAKSSHTDFSEAMKIDPVNINEVYQRMKYRKCWTRMQTFINKKDDYNISMSLYDNSALPYNQPDSPVTKKESLVIYQQKTVEKEKNEIEPEKTIEHQKSIDDGCDVSEHDSDNKVAGYMDKINSGGIAYAEFNSKFSLKDDNKSDTEKRSEDKYKQLVEFAHDAMNMYECDQKLDKKPKNNTIKSDKEGDIQIVPPPIGSPISFSATPKMRTETLIKGDSPENQTPLTIWEEAHKEGQTQEGKKNTEINDFFFTGLTPVQKDNILKQALLEKSNIKNLDVYDNEQPNPPYLKSKIQIENMDHVVNYIQDLNRNSNMQYNDEEEIDDEKSNNIYKTQHTISKYIDREQLEKLDENIEVSVTEGIDSKLEIEKKDEWGGTASIVTTKREFVSIQLRQNIINSEIKRKIIILNRINVIALVLFQILILSLRVLVLFSNNGLKNNYEVMMQVNDSLEPLGWFVKENGKYNLEKLAYLDTTTIKAGGNLIYDNAKTVDFYSKMMTLFSYYNKNFTAGFFMENTNIDQRIYDQFLAPTENVNQIFLLGQNMFDYYNFQRGYVAATDSYEDIYFFDREAAYNNFIELTYSYNTELATLNTQIKEFDDYYKYNLLYQEIGVATFTTSQCMLMIYVLFIMGNLLKDMSNLFQKLDKKIIDKLYKKYYDMYAMLEQIDEEVIDMEYYWEDESRTNQLTDLKVSKNKESKNESSNKKSEHSGSSNKRQQKKKKKQANTSSNKSRFSIFINEYKFSLARFGLVIVLLILFANIPFLVDYIISTDLLNKISKITECGTLINSLSGNLALYYGLFYEKLAFIRAGTTIPSTTTDSFTVQDQSQRNRDIFQDEYISEGVLKTAYNTTLCELYYQKTGNDKTNCMKVTENKSSYSLFIGLSDVFSFYDQTISSAQSTPSHIDSIVSSIDFIYMDGLVYYSMVICEMYTADLSDELNNLLMQNKLYGLVFIILFPTLIGIYYYMFRVNFNKKMDSRLTKIENSILLLPDELLVANLYIRNYFDIKY